MFRQLKGVKKVVSGYGGGKTANPSYEEVCGGKSLHFELVQVTFDPKLISPEDVLTAFFFMHDPTQEDGQGMDIGYQYLSVIFYQNEEEKTLFEKVMSDVNQKYYDGRMVTHLLKFESFYPAEDYHQDYYANNPDKPYCKTVIEPKIKKFRKEFLDKFNADA